MDEMDALIAALEKENTALVKQVKALQVYREAWRLHHAWRNAWAKSMTNTEHAALTRERDEAAQIADRQIIAEERNIPS